MYAWCCCCAQVNYISVVAMCQLVTPYMVAQQSGTIINIGSSAGYIYLPQACAVSVMLAFGTRRVWHAHSLLSSCKTLAQW